MLQAGFLKSFTGRVTFSNFAGLLLRIHVHSFLFMQIRSLLIYLEILGESFFRQLWFAASLRKEF